MGETPAPAVEETPPTEETPDPPAAEPKGRRRPQTTESAAELGTEELADVIGKAAGAAAVEAVNARLGQLVTPPAVPEPKKEEEPVTAKKEEEPADLDAKINKALEEAQAKKDHDAEHAAMKGGAEPAKKAPAPELPPKPKARWLARKLLRVG